MRSDNFTMFTTTYLTRPRKHRSSPRYSLVSVEGRGGGRKVNLWGQTRVGGWLEARDPILANARETLCISPAHIDTLIPRETEVWWQNICRSNRRSRSCESPASSRVVPRRDSDLFIELSGIALATCLNVQPLQLFLPISTFSQQRDHR